MFNIFIKSHLLTKKFFTFLIGSTLLANKYKSHSSYDTSAIKENYYSQTKCDKLHINNCKNSDDEDRVKAAFFFSNIKYLENIDYEFYVNFLLQNLAISFNSILSYLINFKKISIMYCEIPKIKKPYLGCSIRANEENTPGMKIVMVKSDSPAEKAGMKVKDIIVEIDGKSVRTINEYNAAIGNEANRKKVKILRIENGKEIFYVVEVDFSYSD